MDYGEGKLDSAVLLDYGVVDTEWPQARAWRQGKWGGRSRDPQPPSPCLTPAASATHPWRPLHLQGGYTLSLSVPDTDRYRDDKLDILERNGLAGAMSFVVKKGEEPGEEMLGFLRLTQLAGERCARQGGKGGVSGGSLARATGRAS
jgi:hypothetical protein